MRYEYKTGNTCSQVINFDIELAKAVREAYDKFSEDKGEVVNLYKPFLDPLNLTYTR